MQSGKYGKISMAQLKLIACINSGRFTPQTTKKYSKSKLVHWINY